MITTTEILKPEQVPIPGADLIAAGQLSDGSVKIPIKPICQGFGMDFSRQLRKLKSYEWSGVDIMSIPDSRGSLQETSVIDLECLPMWLATIHLSRVSLEARPKLAIYQREAKRVLAEHFLGKTKIKTVDPIMETARNVVAIAELLRDQADRVLALEHKADEALRIANDALGQVETAVGPLGNPADHMTLRSFCKVKGLQLTPAENNAHGQAIAARCRRAKIPVPQVSNRGRVAVNLYPVSILAAWYESQRQPLMFP